VYLPTRGEFAREFALLCCTVHRTPAAQQDRLKKVVSCRDDLQSDEDGLTNNPVTVLSDIVLDGLFPAEGLLGIDFNTSIT